MAIETSFTIKQVNVDEALKQAEAKAKKSAANIDNSLNKSSGTANKMTNTLKSGLQGASKLGTKLGGTLKNVFSGVMAGGIWGVVIAGATMAIQRIYQMWQDATLSFEEKITMLTDKVSAAKERSQQTKNEHQYLQSYMKTLEELNNLQENSFEKRTQMVDHLKILQARYGDLGLQVDATTGKIKGLGQALTKIKYKQIGQQIANKNGEIKDQTRLLEAQMSEVNKILEIVDWQADPETGAMIPVYGRKYNFKMKDLSEQGLNQAMQKAASNPEEYNKLKALRDRFIEYQKLQKDMEKLSEKRHTINTPYYMELAGRRKRNRDLGKQLKDIDRQSEFAKKASGGADRQRDILRQRQAYNQGEQQKAKNRISNIQAWRRKKIWRRDDLRRKQRQSGLSREQTSELLVLERQILGAGINIEKNREKQLQHQAQSKKIAAQIAEIERQRKQYVEDMKTADEQQAAVLTLQIKGRYEEAAQLQLINSLKQRGIKLDKRQLTEVTKRKKALKDLQIKSAFGDNLHNMLYSRMPNKKQAEYEKRKRDMQRQYGKSLSGEQKTTLKKIIDLEFTDIPKPDFSQLDIKTNELTQRGGFQTGAVMQNTNTINKQIRDYSAKQNAVLQQIRQLIKDGGYI